MRAVVLRAYGATPQLGEFDDPAPSGDDDVVVEVLAAGLNPVDISVASGRFYGGAPPLPCVPGREGVGRLTGGGRVYFDQCVAPYGSLAERTMVRASGTVAVPQGLDDALAVAVGTAGLAAWLSLQWRAKLQPGESVLVLGASGVVGQIAVQAARLLGAGRVVAAARNPERLEHARELGADATVRLGEHEDLAGALREAGGGGFDVVVDPLWGKPAEAAVDALHPGGRLVQLGQSAGPDATLASATVRGRMLSILGFTNLRVPDEDRYAAYAQVAAHAASGAIAVDVETIGLARIAEAWARQKAGPGRKLVLTP